MLNFQINESIAKAYGSMYRPSRPYCTVDESDDDVEIDYDTDADVDVDDGTEDDNEEEEASQDMEASATTTASTPTQNGAFGGSNPSKPLKVSSNQEILDRMKSQKFNDGYLSNFFSKETGKEALKGAARATVDVGTGVAKLGTGLGRLIGAGEYVDKIDKGIDDVAYRFKHDQLGSDWGDEVTELSDTPGMVASEALQAAIPLKLLSKAGKAAAFLSKAGGVADKTGKFVNAAKKVYDAGKAAKTAAKVVDGGEKVSNLAKAGSAAKNLAVRGLKGYGWYGGGNEVGDLLDEGGFHDAAKIARTTGAVLGAKAALGPLGPKRSLMRKLAFGGGSAGYGIQQGVRDASANMAEKGLISQETKDKIDTAGSYLGLGAVGKHLWDAGDELIEKGVEKGADYYYSKHPPTVGDDVEDGEDGKDYGSGENDGNGTFDYDAYLSDLESDSDDGNAEGDGMEAAVGVKDYESEEEDSDGFDYDTYLAELETSTTAR